MTEYFQVFATYHSDELRFSNLMHMKECNMFFDISYDWVRGYPQTTTALAQTIRTSMFFWNFPH